MLKPLLIGLGLAFVLLDSGMGDIVAVSNAAESGYAPQTSDAREIKVTVTPQNISSGGKTWDFSVTAESHTKSIDDDLARSAVLIADGRRYEPLTWEGAPPGGHHRKGVLRFTAIKPVQASIELQIRLNGEAAPRSFRWMLKGKGYGS
ncbi:MAG TPA: hypothetical protein VFP33_10205 [Gallionella sp.]|nr:hypothetical protein [Gallionella sp.]